MPIYAISDLHLCDRGRATISLSTAVRIASAVPGHGGSGKGRLLILGDLFDFWQVNLGTAVVAYLPLLDRLARMGATWIVGNHDNLASLSARN